MLHTDTVEGACYTHTHDMCVNAPESTLLDLPVSFASSALVCMAWILTDDSNLDNRHTQTQTHRHRQTLSLVVSVQYPQNPAAVYIHTCINTIHT